jgi:hypothetical protein
MKAVTGMQKLPGRGRQTGWQWQGQRGRLADSPQAGRKVVDSTEEKANRQKQGGRQGQIGRGRQEWRSRQAYMQAHGQQRRDR